MAHLCAMKRTAQLTKTELTAWHAVLGLFRVEILNTAVIATVLSESRFPELGDLYQLCRKEALRRGDIKLPYSPHGGEKDITTPTAAEVGAVADRLGLKV